MKNKGEQRRSGPFVVAKNTHNPKLPEVTQRDLEEIILLRREFLEARERYQLLRAKLQDALVRGADVEYGVHTASLIASRRFCFR